jgi:hypothetical protein
VTAAPARWHLNREEPQMRTEASEAAGWTPLIGSYEEAVLSWQEQVEKAFAEVRSASAPPQGLDTPSRSTRAAAPAGRDHPLTPCP